MITLCKDCQEQNKKKLEELIKEHRDLKEELREAKNKNVHGLRWITDLTRKEKEN